MIAFLHDTVFSHTVEICGHAEFHLKLGCVRHKVRAGGPSAYLQMPARPLGRWRESAAAIDLEWTPG